MASSYANTQALLTAKSAFNRREGPQLHGAYNKFDFPEGRPLPFFDAIGSKYTHESKWDDIVGRDALWNDPDPKKRRIFRGRYYRRQACFTLCCCGVGFRAFGFGDRAYIWIASIVLGQVWYQFVAVHLKPLFADGEREWPNAQNDLAFGIAATLLAAFLYGLGSVLTSTYYRCRPRKLRVNRFAREHLDSVLRQYDPYAVDDLDGYDSMIEPIEDYMWNRENEVLHASSSLYVYTEDQQESIRQKCGEIIGRRELRKAQYKRSKSR